MQKLTRLSMMSPCFSRYKVYHTSTNADYQQLSTDSIMTMVREGKI
jgi:hypothetical protein